MYSLSPVYPSHPVFMYFYDAHLSFGLNITHGLLCWDSKASSSSTFPITFNAFRTELRLLGISTVKRSGWRDPSHPGSLHVLVWPTSQYCLYPTVLFCSQLTALHCSAWLSPLICLTVYFKGALINAILIEQSNLHQYDHKHVNRRFGLTC